MPIRLMRPMRSLPGHCLGMVVALLFGVSATAGAQRTGGSIDVSLTIVESVETRALEVTGFRLEGDGRATIETTSSGAGAVSRIVMTRVSSSASAFRPVELAPALLAGATEIGAPDVGARRMSRLVDVGGASPEPIARDVRLRIEYLVVAGT